MTQSNTYLIGSFYFGVINFILYTQVEWQHVSRLNYNWYTLYVLYMLPRNKVDTNWSPKLAYLIGLIASDGNLSTSGRHINITSKDLILLENIKREFKLSNKIGTKARGGSKIKKYHVLQFGDINLYRFLESVGLHQNKSRTLARLLVPRKLFAHFLRGVIDGDGNISVSSHPDSTHKQLRLRVISASPDFIRYIHEEICLLYKIDGGWIYTQKLKSVQTLNFGKEDSIKILNNVYTNKGSLYLPRKYNIAKVFI